jgi:transposase-like protein
MGKKYRRFENTFKRHIVEQIESGRMRISDAAREYQISYSLLYLWRRQYHKTQFVEVQSPKERQLQAENEKLRAKIGDLVMQLDHLKKWQAWGPQQKSDDTSVITAKNLEAFRKAAK